MIPLQLSQTGFRFCKLNGKIPCEKDWQNTKNYSYNDPELTDWLTASNNIGVVTGYNLLLVLDFDDMEFYNKYKDKLPETFTVLSGGRSLPHMYYIVKDCDSAPNFKHGKLDIKGLGGQVVCPGSKISREDGTIGEYVVSNNIPISNISYNLIKKLFGIKKSISPERINNLLKIGASPGERNDSYFKLACSRRKAGIDYETSLNEIKLINNKSGNPLPDIEIINSVNSAYRYQTEEKRESKEKEEDNDTGPIDLPQLHETFKKWLYLKSTNRLDLMLAVHLSRLLKGTKIWLVIVGGSGGLKSEQIRTLDDDGKTTYVLQEITPNTLVSGNPMARDLAPELDNKTVLIYDAAVLTNLNKDDKAKIWAQFRELYDGNCSKATGSGKITHRYSGLNVTLIMCSTGAIDSQILIHTNLGTRELIYRLEPLEEKEEEEKLMKQVLKNEEHETQMRHELRTAVQLFLKDHEVKEIKVPDNVMTVIKEYVHFLTILRVNPQLDSYSGELVGSAEPEYPTRILKQLKRLYQCLKSLDDNYPDKTALEILKELRDSNINQDRLNVLKFLIKNPNESFKYHEIGAAVRLGNSTIKRHCMVLWNLGLINRTIDESLQYKESYFWQVNKEHHVVIGISKELELPDFDNCRSTVVSPVDVQEEDIK